MQNIDFLPQRYRERRIRRKTQLWRFMVLAMLGVVVAAAATGQLLLRRSVATELRSLAGSHAMAAARNTQYANLQQRLTKAEDYATLYAYLDHPWPRTRILKELTIALPDTVTLQQVSIAPHTRVVKAPVVRQRRQRQNAESATQNLPAPQADFQQLRLKYQKNQLEARVVGITSQVSDLHAFITHLNNSPLFVRAELTSLESAEEHTLSRLARFEILLHVLPPHASDAAPAGPVLPRDKNAKPAPPTPPVHATAADLTRSTNNEEG